MILDALTIQKGLYVLGFDPGPRDGKAGDQTIAALQEMAEASGVPIEVRKAGACTPTETSLWCTKLEVTPDVAAITIKGNAARYEQIVAARTPQDTSAPIVGQDIPPLTVADVSDTGLPFWRSDNVWAWVAVGVPVALGLGGIGWWLTRRRRGGR